MRLSSLKDDETGQRGYRLTGNPEFRQPYLAGRNELPVQLASLRSLLRDDSAQLALLARVESLIEQKQAFAEQTTALRRSGDIQR